LAAAVGSRPSAERTRIATLLTALIESEKKICQTFVISFWRKAQELRWTQVHSSGQNLSFYPLVLEINALF
jgi:hypothetical protein